MKDDSCIFCKIANGEIPSATVYEDEDFRVILDMGPASRAGSGGCQKGSSGMRQGGSGDEKIPGMRRI